MRLCVGHWQAIERGSIKGEPTLRLLRRLLLVLLAIVIAAAIASMIVSESVNSVGVTGVEVLRLGGQRENLAQVRARVCVSGWLRRSPLGCADCSILNMCVHLPHRKWQP